MEGNVLLDMDRKRIELLEQQLASKCDEIEHMRKQLESKERLFDISEKINKDLREQIQVLSAKLQSYGKIDKLLNKSKVHSSSQTDLSTRSQFNDEWHSQNKTQSTDKKQLSGSTKSLSPPLLSKASLESLLVDRRVILSGGKSRLSQSLNSVSSASKSVVAEDGVCKNGCDGANQTTTNSWQRESNNTQTRISDLVRNCVNQSMSSAEETPVQEDDYVYDERSRTYYSPSTQLYWYPDSSFFYDPKSSSYYHYDSARKSIQFHSTLRLDQSSNISECNVGEIQDGAKSYVVAAPVRNYCLPRPSSVNKRTAAIDQSLSSTIDDIDQHHIVEVDNNDLSETNEVISSFTVREFGRHESESINNKPGKAFACIENNKTKNQPLTPQENITSKELEEGELSDSSSISASSYIVEEIKLTDNGANDKNDRCPPLSLEEIDTKLTYIGVYKDAPCLRMIVMRSEKLDLGSLLLITPVGGIIGSIQESHVCVPDEGIKPRHCKVYYNNEVLGYCLLDLSEDGSTYLSYDNGLSFENITKGNKQLILTHASILRLGLFTDLLIHIHSGRDVTCNECEPGIVQQRLRIEQSKSDSNREEPLNCRKNKEKDRRSTLKALKRKYGVDGGVMSSDVIEVANNIVDSHGSFSAENPSLIPQGDQSQPSSKKKQLYRDRAAERRATGVGSQNPYEKTDLTVGERPIGPQNKGYKLLTKMGWSAGQRLGTDSTNQSNLLEPLMVTGHLGTSGLGSTISASNSALNHKTAKSRTSSHLDDDFSDI